MKFYGRPLRFLAIILLSWLVSRIYFISPFAPGSDAPQGPVIAAVAPRPSVPMPAPAPEPEAIDFAEAPPAPIEALFAPSRPRGFTVGIARPARMARAPVRMARQSVAPPPRFDPQRFDPPMAVAAPPPAMPVAPTPPPPSFVAVLAPSPAAPASPRRLSGYAYLFAREGGGQTGLAGGFAQLGGSQAGARLDYALAKDPSRGLGLTARISIPLNTRLGREAAFGIKYRPARSVPITFVAERRVKLGDGGRNAFAAYAYGGVGPVALPADFRLEAYGQAGIVGLKRGDGFVDGQATMLRTVTDNGKVNLSIGAGVWGAAQPGASRLDIGPRARLGFQAGGKSVGLSVDYRQRISGNAQPDSGVAVTLDAGF